MQSGGDSKSTKADIVIVGGGPATLGLITNALKQNRLHELVATGDGLAIIEQGMTLGGGELQNFGVNSNTSARGFLKCAYKKREVAAPSNNTDHGENNNNKNSNKKSGEKASPAPKKKAADADEEESEEELAEDSERGDASDDEPQKQKQWQTVPLNCFKDFYQLAPIYKAMAEYGSLIVPLSVVGMYLNYCGNHILHYIYTVMRRRVFYPCHRVTSIQLLQSGEILTHAVKRIFSLKGEKDGSVSVGTERTQVVTFRSKAIVVSNGGRQALPPAFFKEWFPFMAERKDRLLLSDTFLKRDVYKATMAMIKERKLKNIVIVGASHSGVSSAWLLLHGPATWKRNNALVRQGKAITRTRFPDAPLKSNPHCGECCSCPDAKKAKNTKCSCLCKCWGYFQYQDWDFDHDNDLATHFEEGSIKILYREKIRVFYGTVNQAKADGYSDFNEHIFSNPNGFVYSYTGLRGDAKWLYRQVKQGHEKRVAFVAAATPAVQAEHIRDADLVIWACGYQTNKIPIRDHEGKEITLSQRVGCTQFDVDGKCRICVSDGSLLTKTFGTGLAYPTRTNDGMMRPDAGKPDPRADSFSLYCGWVGNRILLNLLPKTVIEAKLHRTMRNNRKKAIQNNPNNNNNQSNAANAKKGGKTDGGTAGQSQAPAKSNSFKKVESVVKKQLKAAALEELARQEGKAKERSPRPASKSKGKSASPVGGKDGDEGNGTKDQGKEGASKPSESKDAGKKAGSQGGYLRGTQASDHRAKLTKASNQEVEPQESPQQERAAPASQAPGIFIPPQITQSQQQYIQRRKEAIEKELAEQQQLMDKHKPPPPQQRNHAAVQSRYLKQAAVVAANGAKKVDAASKGAGPAPVQVKKAQTSHAGKAKNKEKAKALNSQVSQSALDQLSSGKPANNLEKSSSKSNFMTAEKAVNNYMQEELRKEAPSPEAVKRVASPPAGSHNNTWSASTEVDRVVKSRAECKNQPSTDEGRESNSEQQRMRAILQGEEVEGAAKEAAKVADRVASPPGLNDAEGEIVHEKATKKSEKSEEESSCSYLDANKQKHLEPTKNLESHINYGLYGAQAIQDEDEAKQIAKLSQNYMIQQSMDRAGTKQLEYGSPQKVSRFLNQHRQSNSQARTQQRKTSGHLLLHNNVEAAGASQMPQQTHSATVQRPLSKNEQEDVARSTALEEYQNLKKVVQEQTEERAKATSPKALSNFQTAEPVSRAQKMRNQLEKVDVANATERVNQSKAHSPEFYTSKVKFTQAYGANFTDTAKPHHNTQKLSSLFNRNVHDGNQGLHYSQSSKGLSFNQYMQKQQEQALQLQNPLLLRQQQMQQHIVNQSTTHRPSKSQWSTTPETSQGQSVHAQYQQPVAAYPNILLQQNGAQIATNNPNLQHAQKHTVMIAQYANIPVKSSVPPNFVHYHKQSADHQPKQNQAVGLGVKAQQIVIPAKNVAFQPIVAAPLPQSLHLVASPGQLQNQATPVALHKKSLNPYSIGGDERLSFQVNSTGTDPSTKKKSIFVHSSHVPNTVKPQVPMKVFQVPGLAGQTAKTMINPPLTQHTPPPVAGIVHQKQNSSMSTNNSDKKPVLLPLNPPFKKVKGSLINFTQQLNNPLMSAGGTVLNPSDVSFSQTNEASYSRQTRDQQIYGHEALGATTMKKMTDSTSSATSLVFKGGVQALTSGKRVNGGPLIEADDVKITSDKRHSHTLKHSTVKFTQSISDIQQQISNKIQSHNQQQINKMGKSIKLHSGETHMYNHFGPSSTLAESPPKKIQKPLPQFVGDQRYVGTIMDSNGGVQNTTGRLIRQSNGLPTVGMMMGAGGPTVSVVNHAGQQFIVQSTHQKGSHLPPGPVGPHGLSHQHPNIQPTAASDMNSSSMPLVTASGMKNSSNTNPPSASNQYQGQKTTIMMNVNLNSPKKIYINQMQRMQGAGMFHHPQQQQAQQQAQHLQTTQRPAN